jgi:anti-sigma-K factor RskA
MTVHTDPFDDGPVPHNDLGAYVLGGLEPDEHQAFEQTLASDPELRRHVEDLRGLPDLLALAALVDGDGLDDLVVPAPVVPLRRATPGDQGHRAHWPTVAAAAIALLLGILGGTLATRSRSPQPDRTVALALPAGGADSPARGTAELYRQHDGVGVRLRMSALTPTDTGSRYECWWVGATGRVAAGSFQVGADGVADVRLTVAANLNSPFRLNINRVANGTDTNVLTATAS